MYTSLSIPFQNQSLDTQTSLSFTSLINPISKSDSLVILRSKDIKKPMNKRFRATPEGLKKQDFQQAKYFSYERHNIATIYDFYSLISEASKDKYNCFIRGEVKKDSPPIITRKKEENGGYINENDHLWFEVDLDQDEKVDCRGIELPFECHTQEDFQKAALWLRDTYLPFEFHGVTCTFQWSASSFLGSPRHAKAHLWFLFDRLVCDATLKPYLKEIGSDSSIANSNHPLYIAPPTFLEKKDPLPVRTFLLSGEKGKDSVLAPPHLLSHKAYKSKVRKEDEERQRKQEQELEARRKNASKMPLQTHRGLKGLKEKINETALTNAFHNIVSAKEGERHITILREANKIGGFISGNELEQSPAESDLKRAVDTLGFSDQERKNEYKAVEDGLANGFKNPFTPDLSWATKNKKPDIPDNYNSLSLEELRKGKLPKSIRQALEKAGVMVLKAPVGSGKTTLLIEELKAFVIKNPNARILYAVPTNRLREEIIKALKKEGLNPVDMMARQKEQCYYWGEYLAAGKLKENGGLEFCKSCPLHTKNGGECSPHSQKRWSGAHIGVCTHTYANTIVTEARESTELGQYNLLVWDEGSKLEYKEIDYTSLFLANELAGVGELIELMKFSLKKEGEKNKSYQGDDPKLIKALQNLTISFNEPGRKRALQQLVSSKEVEEVNRYPDFKVLGLLQKAKEAKNFTGFYVQNGVLFIPVYPEFPEVENALILDATATPRISQVLYKDHSYIELSLAPPKALEHLHVNLNAGSSAAKITNGKLAWESDKGQRTWDSLRSLFSESLFIGFKSWQEPEKAQLYINGVEARGSNRYKDYDSCIITDFHVPKATIEANVATVQRELQAQGITTPLEEIRKEVVYQLELAPMIQAIGRIRPFDTGKKPKIIITLGSKNRLYGHLAKEEKSYEMNPSEIRTWAGELTHDLAFHALKAIAKKRLGITKEELKSLNIVNLTPFEITGRTTDSPFLNPIIHRKHTYRTQLIKAEWHESSITDPFTKKKLSLEVTNPIGKISFLPSSMKNAKKELIIFAKRKGWDWIETKFGKQSFLWDKVILGIPKHITKREQAVGYLISKGLSTSGAYKRYDRALKAENYSYLQDLSFHSTPLRDVPKDIKGHLGRVWKKDNTLENKRKMVESKSHSFFKDSGLFTSRKKSEVFGKETSTFCLSMKVEEREKKTMG